jgi:hypothetical protein
MHDGDVKRYIDPSRFASSNPALAETVAFSLKIEDERHRGTTLARAIRRVVPPHEFALKKSVEILAQYGPAIQAKFIRLMAVENARNRTRSY